MNLSEAREFFQNDRFATNATGIVIDEVGNNYSQCHLDIEDKHLAAANQVMGGVFFTLGDFAFAVATNTPDKLTVTTNASISYLAQPKDKKLVAKCNCIKDGRTTCFYEVNIYDGLGNLLAVFSANGLHILEKA